MHSLSTSSIRVLLVEGNAQDALFIQRLLAPDGSDRFRVTTTSSLAAATQQLNQDDFDVALLDLDLPDAQGLVAFEKIRALDSRLPVVMLTSSEDEQAGIEAIESGVQDFLAKQHISGRMLDRVLRFAIARQLKVMGIQAAADTDPLTGLHNRRYLQSYFIECLREAKKGFRPTCLSILDVDHFKQINDRYGHFVGDVILKHIATVLINELPRSACVTRIGGEEFALLLPDVSLEQASKCIESLLKRLAETGVLVEQTKVFATASAGLIQLQPSDTWDQAYIAADAALYRAKSLGRNQCHCASRKDVAGYCCQK